MVALAKKFDPVIFDNPANVTCLGFKAAFIHALEVKCDEDCGDARHFRLLNLETEKEITSIFARIDAMCEVWHGKVGN
jgi:hypothetical protein